MPDIIAKLRAISGHLIDPDVAVTIFEKLPFAIVVVDSTGSIQLVNEQAELMFGYARSEMFDQHVEMLLPEAVREIHVQHRGKFLYDPRTRQMGQDLALKARTKEGVEFPLDIYLAPIITKQGLFTLAVARKK